jgi:hypothetical protein
MLANSVARVGLLDRRCQMRAFDTSVEQTEARNAPGLGTLRSLRNLGQNGNCRPVVTLFLPAERDCQRAGIAARIWKNSA